MLWHLIISNPFTFCLKYATGTRIFLLLWSLCFNRVKKHYTNKYYRCDRCYKRFMVLQQHTVVISGLLQRVRAGCPKEDLKDKPMLTERQWVVREGKKLHGDSGGQIIKSTLMLISLSPQGPGKALKGNGKQRGTPDHFTSGRPWLQHRNWCPMEFLTETAVSELKWSNWWWWRGREMKDS